MKKKPKKTEKMKMPYLKIEDLIEAVLGSDNQSNPVGSAVFLTENHFSTREDAAAWLRKVIEQERSKHENGETG